MRFLAIRERDPERRHDLLGDFVLNVENIINVPVETLGPNMTAVMGVDELSGDPQAIAAASNTAFQDIAHVQFTGELARINRVVLVGEGRIAGDHAHPGDLRQGGDNILGHAIGEKLMLSETDLI